MNVKLYVKDTVERIEEYHEVTKITQLKKARILRIESVFMDPIHLPVGIIIKLEITY